MQNNEKPLLNEWFLKDLARRVVIFVRKTTAKRKCLGINSKQKSRNRQFWYFGSDI